MQRKPSSKAAPRSATDDRHSPTKVEAATLNSTPTSPTTRPPSGYEEREYDPSTCAVFCKTRERFGGLSNMASGYPLRLGDVDVPSSEALYQACRFPHIPALQYDIIKQKSPMSAKMVGKPHRQESRADWDLVRVRIMRWCLRVKLAQHWKRFGDVLRETGDMAIVEWSRHDTFWGTVKQPDGKLAGINALGRLLMQLRSLLRESYHELVVVEPPRLPNFLLLERPIPVFRAPVDIAEKMTEELATAAKLHSAETPDPLLFPEVFAIARVR